MGKSVPRKPSPGERSRRQASTCHASPHQARVTERQRGGSILSVESFVVMENDEKKPKLKPIRGKETGEILAFEMTYPELHPKFSAKFKRQRLKNAGTTGRKISTLR